MQCGEEKEDAAMILLHLVQQSTLRYAQMWERQSVHESVFVGTIIVGLLYFAQSYICSFPGKISAVRRKK